jgi:hydrogenase/urease accessory protein HupE
MVWLKSPTTRFIGYLAGVASVALLVQRAAVFVFIPSGMPQASNELALMAAVLGAVMPSIGSNRRSAILSFVAFLGIGLALGLSGFGAPFGTLFVYGSLFLFGLSLAIQKPLPRQFGLPLGALAAGGHGWHTGSAMAENVSLPVASATGAGVVALCVFTASYGLAASTRSKERRWGLRLLGVVATLLAVGWRFGEYARWYDVQVATEAALGLFRLPLLALALIVAAVLLWPRRQRVLRELGMETRKTVTHWVLLGVALFLIPVGTVALPNPFFEPTAPRGEDARRVVSRVLWDTYHSLNIKSENELYDRLALSVTGELLADVYLDSRRRLTAGTREGAEVTVRDVTVVEVDDSARGTDNETGFSYPCRWIVTARVRHLQHVHHRQNIYSGNLTIRVDDERWKIAGVELTSEERVVLPWKPT